MIISASYKTDIPTFYGEWFMNRLRAGYCKMVNPYGRQVYTASLAQEDVDGIVFWTKNIGPFMQHLPGLHERGYPFVVQHTINGYPRELESRVIDYEHTVECLRRVSGEYGVDRAIWRYDPIVITSITSIDWHKRNFENLARKLQGATSQVVISFAQIYRKTKRNMDESAKANGFSWDAHEPTCYPNDPSDTRAVAFATNLAEIARAFGMDLRVCSQERFLVPGIIQEAHCIDASWFGQEYKRKGNRKECACSASRDIGEYDTCPHGCVYCYAVQNRQKALDRYKQHDPNGEFLFPPEFPTIQIEPSKAAKGVAHKSGKMLAQLPLLSDTSRAE